MIPGLRGLVLHDDAATRRSVGLVMERCGFESAAMVDTPDHAVRTAGAAPPHAIVADLALAASNRFEVLCALRTAAPDSAIVVLSPFETMQLSALEAGASAFVGNSDLGQLERCLRKVAREAARSAAAGGSGGVAAAREASTGP